MSALFKKVIIFLCGICFVLDIANSVMQYGLDRELKFCKQTKLSAVYSLDDLTFVQFMDAQWMSHGGNYEEHEHWSLPKQEKTIRQLFFLKAKTDHKDYVSLIHGGITGFLVSSSNFTSFPKDTGLLMSTDYDYFVWIRRSKHCTCIACTHFLSWADGNKDTSRMNVLIDGLKGAKHKVTHYIESSNKLIVAYTKANTDAGYQMIAIYSGSLNNVQMINTFSNEQGFIKGLFHLSGRMYYIAERMLGTFDPSAMTFTAEPDRPLAKGAKVYGEKSLLNLQDLFGCLTSEQDEQPQEFSNFNTVNIWLNVVLGAVNSLLIGGIIVFCFLIFQPSHLQESRNRHHQNPRNTRSDR